LRRRVLRAASYSDRFMTAFTQALQRIPPGSAVLFFIQLVATLGYAVLYSTLVLYATQALKFSNEAAAQMMGVFGAFNYGLHLVGGWMGGRLLSNRNLFVIGMALQVAGCGLIAQGSVLSLQWGLALFLTGSGLNVTCLNMMLTQRFAPEDERREAAFLWNYAGMNIGFFIGFAVAGHYQLTQRYPELFWFATVGNAAAIALTLLWWKSVADRDTPLLQATAAQWRLRLLAGVIGIALLVPLLATLLRNPADTALWLKGFCLLVVAYLLALVLRHREAAERDRMKAFLVLTLGSLVFWSLYQMAPNGLQLFAVGNVRMELWGQVVAPQWVQNINTVVIVIGAPLLAEGFRRLRARGLWVDVPQQFALALLLMALGFLALPLGIHFAGADGRSAFGWLALSYVLQALGELLISPIGYAMVGKLIPKQHQGLMMGSWMLVTGLASLFAADFSALVAQPTDGLPATSNPAYQQLFLQLGLGALVTAALLALLVPWLRRLIGR
jgi:POT family proton-dependent oligopeptide transporter